MDDGSLLQLAWDAVVSDAALARLMEGLATAFACRSSILLYADSGQPRVDLMVAHGPFADPDIWRRYTEFAHLDPAPEALSRLSLGQAASTETLFDGLQQRYEPFLKGFYYPIGLAEALGAPLTKAAGVTGVVAVHRGPERASFVADDERRMERLVPHLSRMLELRRLFYEVEEKSQGLESALDEMAAPVLILDAAGLLKSANVAARNVLAKRDCLALNLNGLVVALSNDADRAIRRTIGAGTSELLIRLPREGADDVYILRLRRRKEGGWTMLISDPDRPSGQRVARLAIALNLTASAADLVVALLEGETLGDYASRRGLSRETAKYHLEAAFAATGTRRQSSLLCHAAVVARDLNF